MQVFNQWFREKLQAEIALIESEKSDLTIEIYFLKDKANKAQIDKNTFKAEALQLRSSLGKAQLDYVITHLQFYFLFEKLSLTVFGCWDSSH